MCRLFDQYRLAHIFAPGFPGLHEAWHVQQKLVELLMPDVHVSFVRPSSSLPLRRAGAQLTRPRTSTLPSQEEHCVHPSSYSSKWYLTLYTNSFPFATQLRLWDALLLEGVDVLIIIAVGIIWHFQRASSRSLVSLAGPKDST